MNKCDVSALERGHHLSFVLVSLTTTGTDKRPRFFRVYIGCEILESISATVP